MLLSGLIPHAQVRGKRRYGEQDRGDLTCCGKEVEDLVSLGNGRLDCLRLRAVVLGDGLGDRLEI